MSDPKYFISPNDEIIVKIYPHGFIEPFTKISEEKGALIGEMAAIAAKKLGGRKKASPFEVFTLMGWNELPASMAETLDRYK